MTRPPAKVLLTLVSFLAGCGPPKPTDKLAHIQYAKESCELFCARAVGCSSTRFAEDWEFTTTSECEAACFDFTEGWSEAFDRSHCWEILGDMFQCGGMIEECVLFEAFEDQAFGIQPLEDHGCESEILEASPACT